MGVGLKFHFRIYFSDCVLAANFALWPFLPSLVADLSTIESSKDPCNGRSSSSLRISSYARWKTRLARGSASRRVRNDWNRSAASIGTAQPREPRQVPLVQQRRTLYGGHQ